MKAEEMSKDLVEQVEAEESEDLDMDALEGIAGGRRVVTPPQKTKKSSVPINMTPMGHIARG